MPDRSNWPVFYTFGLAVKYLFAGLSIIGLAGCQQTAPLQTHIAKESTAAINTPVAVYSTYLSESAQARCTSVNQQQCTDDVISSEEFFSAINELAFLPQAEKSVHHTDYELLIGNQATSVDVATWWQKGLHSLSAGQYALPVETHYFTEVTLQWRGVELDTHLITTQSVAGNSETPDSQAKAILSQWQAHALQSDVFGAPFLFSAMQASDYLNQMEVPSQIASFTLSDTQLYHDPFKGVISRYTHPEFDGALIDITVFPITSSLSAGNEKLLQSVLTQELDDAGIIADARGMSLSVDAPVTPFHFESGNTSYEGFMMAVSANSEASEQLFASTYVFRQHDKIIKLSTTFPPRVSDALIATAIPKIRVPAESVLMATLREIRESQQSAVN